MLRPLDRSSELPLQTQLLEQIRQLIDTGRLPALSRMPSTRALSATLRISRMTVLLAYDQLIAEGYLQTEPAVGTFVGARPPQAAPRVAGDVGIGYDVNPLPAGAGDRPPLADLRVVGGDHGLFPSRAWRRLVSQVLTEQGGEPASADPAGLSRLRLAVSRHVSGQIGAPVAAEQILIVSGLPQAAHILARLLLGRDRIAFVDMPFPRSAAAALAEGGAEVSPPPAEGSNPFLRADGKTRGRVGLVWLAPPPTAAGEDRSEWWKRREALAEWAHRVGAAVVEHWGSHSAAFSARPVNGSALQRTIGVASFSRALTRGTRLAYMIMPPDLVEPARAVKAMFDDAHAWLEQMTLARFIEEGSYTRHVRRVEKVYQARRGALVAALETRFPGPAIEEAPGECHIRWRLPPGFPSAMDIQQRARQRGVFVDIADECFVNPPSGVNDLCLGYGSIDENGIAAGVSELADVIADLRFGLADGCVADVDQRDWKYA